MNKFFNLKIFPGHEGIYYNRDLNYILRIIEKLSNELSLRKQDIDWLQGIIELFLILNSRIYKDLLPDLIDVCSKYQKIDTQKIKLKLEKISNQTLSYNYHKNGKLYRHRAAHGSNYLRVGIIEFKNDVLPKPISYKQTQKLANMANIKDFIGMWQKDMQRVAKDLETIIGIIVGELNKSKLIENNLKNEIK